MFTQLTRAEEKRALVYMWVAAMVVVGALHCCVGSGSCLKMTTFGIYR